jgi:hypothetical protein
MAVLMASLDLSPILTPIFQVVGIAVSGIIAIYIPKALAAFQARTGIQLTEQQRATVLGAVQTAAGTLETKLDQGVVNVAQIHIEDASVREQAQKAINAVPNAMASLGMTPDSVARMIVGKVDTAAHGPDAAPNITNVGTVVTTGAISPPLRQVT